MKKLFLILSSSFMLSACTQGGTYEMLSDPRDELEVFKYYYSDGAYIYVARFKDQPNVVTTTRTGKHPQPTVTIYENDSIIVQQKQQIEYNGR